MLTAMSYSVFSDFVEARASVGAYEWREVQGLINARHHEAALAKAALLG